MYGAGQVERARVELALFAVRTGHLSLPGGDLRVTAGDRHFFPDAEPNDSPSSHRVGATVKSRERLPCIYNATLVAFSMPNAAEV